MQLENRTFADVTLCGQTVSAQSELVSTDIINLTVEKAASCDYVLVGGRLCYTIVITNDSDVDFIEGQDELGKIIFRDPLADNLTYVTDSFTISINGGTAVPATPTLVGNVLTYDGIELEAGQFATVVFCVIVGLPEEDED